MSDKKNTNGKFQKILALMLGVLFGFLLQRGGVTRYEVIMGQLLLVDWTVLKVMASAILTGMVVLSISRSMGLARMHSWKGAWGGTVVGGLIFGVGFGILGYCPGTSIGAVGQGSLDALFGGVLGMLAGASLYALVYERVEPIQAKGEFKATTLPELFHLSWFKTQLILLALFGAVFFALEKIGF